jgi:succinylglutamate desuccinylase
MLTIRETVPDGLLTRAAHELHQVLDGPTLLHLPGRRPEPLFVSVLLHGDETTGWDAVRRLLQSAGTLPRALSLFIGNVQAARDVCRRLPGRPDYNRIWTETPATANTPERAMARTVLDEMGKRRVFASIDIHNTTGRNPHYACVRRLDPRSLQLATLFGRTVVYFTKPDGLQSHGFAPLCPAVTVECGQSGQPAGIAHAADYMQACLQLADIPAHPVAAHDIDLYRGVGIVRVPANVSFRFDDDAAADIQLIGDLDHLNFRELPADTVLGRVRPGSTARLEVWDEHGCDIAEQYLRIVDGEIRTRQSLMPSMFTVNARAVRDDCLGYFMVKTREANFAPTH